MNTSKGGLDENDGIGRSFTALENIFTFSGVIATLPDGQGFAQFDTLTRPGEELQELKSQSGDFLTADSFRDTKFEKLKSFWFEVCCH